jgi:hypothetical protein
MDVMTLPLEYQSQTPPGIPPARLRAARQATWIGIPDILIGATCLGACFWTLPSPLDANMIRLWKIIAAYGVFFLACGTFTILAAPRIKTGSPAWHRALILAASLQIAAVLAWYACLTLNSMWILWANFASLLFGSLIILGQLRMIWSVRKLRKELELPH